MIEALSQPDVQAFLKAHATDSPAKLALQRHLPGGVSAPLLASQLKARQKAKDKLPSWLGWDGIIFPHGVAMEQCSSETTASWKAGQYKGASFADLTGGAGVDAFFLSRSFARGVYAEADAERCDLARHNFGVLGAQHLQVVQSTAEAFLATNKDSFDLIYIDPDRRAAHKRAVGFSDSTPDVVQLMPELLKRANTVLIKASPMIDIRQGIRDLGAVRKVTVLAVNNECKEVLFECGAAAQPLQIEAVHLLQGKEHQFVFDPEEEATAEVTLAHVQAYLYDPNVAITKAGAFRTVASRYGLGKPHVNTHLYTSDTLVPDFPGRVFKVLDVLPFSSKGLKRLKLPFAKAHVMSKNFPLEAAELQKRLKLKEGEEGFVMGVTVGNGERVLVVAERVN
ncbi:RsmD family RNA methyltransferase [uncultured Imperialibacter sp.]|uniref:class I SAM-dependent methyltransferase n=1 Tax=uncultured Imperialibacter sp. TaxID=1672639 RepID=UPI0030D7D030